MSKMGRDFIYYFYDETKEQIKNSRYFQLGFSEYSDSRDFQGIYEVFGEYLEKRYEDSMYGYYTLEEIENCINEAGKKFTPKQLLTCYPDLYDIDDLLREIYQLSQILKDAESHNENDDNKIVYISFNYI